MSEKKLRQTIVLVGLMGAGKTTIGKKLASFLKVPFQDSDDEIALAAGCSIPDIFAIHGEAIFRDLEQRVICRLIEDKTPRILATGGGAWMNAEVRSHIKKNALSVWLRADIDILLDRVSRRDTRPLLATGDKRAILEKLMQERYPLYAEADLTIETGHNDQNKIIRKIVDNV